MLKLSSLENTYYKDDNVAIFEGSSLPVLESLPSESIDCVVTSPPYWALRDYGTEGIVWDGSPECDHEWLDTVNNSCAKCGAWKGSLGLEPDFKLYIKHLLDIFDEVKRVLKDSGTLWVNIADTYSGSHQGYGKSTLSRLSGKNKENLGSTDSYLQKYSHTINTPPPNSKTSIPDKSLCLIPNRFSIGMLDRGWICRNDIIWHKPSCMPQSVYDRFTIDYEHVFFFVKNKKYYFKQQFEPFRDSSLLRAKYGYHSKKTDTGIHGGMTSKTQAEAARKMVTGELPGRNKRCVWNIASQSFKGSHFAVYPPMLIKPMIDAGCPEGGIVLDPFAGSGTTGLVAKQLRRRFIGIELSKKYIDEIIMPRLVAEAVLV